MLHTCWRTLSILLVRATSSTSYEVLIETEDRRLDWLASCLFWTSATSETAWFPWMFTSGPLVQLLCPRESLWIQVLNVLFSWNQQIPWGQSNCFFGFTFSKLWIPFLSLPAATIPKKTTNISIPDSWPSFGLWVSVKCLWLTFRSLNTGSIHVIWKTHIL